MNNTEIFLTSDLHLEHNAALIQLETFLERVIPLPTTTNATLILNGDISPNPQDIQRTIKWANQFYKTVIFVPGNHEYYGHDFKTMAYHKRFVVDTDDIRFICAIGWPNTHRRGNHNIIRRYIHDFRAIKNLNMLEEAHEDRLFLERELSRPTDKTLIAVTHFPPSRTCKSDKFPNGPLDDYFYAEYDDLFPLVDRWFYGHTHDNVTTGLCYANAYGYHEGETTYSKNFI